MSEAFSFSDNEPIKIIRVQVTRHVCMHESGSFTFALNNGLLNCDGIRIIKDNDVFFTIQVSKCHLTLLFARVK